MYSRSLLAALATAAVALPYSGFAFAGDRFEWPELPYEPCYRIERMLQPSDVCPQGGVAISGFAINSHGTIVGAAQCGLTGPTRAFIWRMNGPFQWVALPTGTTQSWATQINNDGWVVGHFHNSNLGTRAYRWNEQTGEFHVTDSSTGITSIRPTGMNSNGAIVGDLRIESGPQVGFIWANGTLTLLRDLYDFEDRSHIPMGIGDDGTITGYFPAGEGGLFASRPFLVKNNQLFEIDHPYPGWQGTTGKAVLPGGRFVGEAWIHPEIEFGSGIVYGDGKGYLGDIRSPAHYNRATPSRTNSAGDIVGGASGSFGWKAIVARGGTIYALKDLVLGDVALNASIARGITDDGQIATGRFHLVPAPPPFGDLSRNCRRDIDDLLLLLGQWGPGEDNPADLNGDGKVDMQDVLLLLNLIAADFSR